MRQLTENIMADCGCSTQYEELRDKIEARLWAHFDEQLAAAQAEINVLREAMIRLVGSEQGERLIHKCKIIAADTERTWIKTK